MIKKKSKRVPKRKNLGGPGSKYVKYVEPKKKPTRAYPKHEKLLAELKARLAAYERTLQCLAEHEPSWEDDFCRAREALKTCARRTQR